MRRSILIAVMLLLTSCGSSVQGGYIIGKYAKVFHGKIINGTKYYLQLEKNNRIGVIEVTKEAWEQAQPDMVWPFEIKE